MAEVETGTRGTHGPLFGALEHEKPLELLEFTLISFLKILPLNLVAAIFLIKIGLGPMQTPAATNFLETN